MCPAVDGQKALSELSARASVRLAGRITGADPVFHSAKGRELARWSISSYSPDDVRPSCIRRSASASAASSSRPYFERAVLPAPAGFRSLQFAARLIRVSTVAELCHIQDPNREQRVNRRCEVTPQREKQSSRACVHPSPARAAAHETAQYGVGANSARRRLSARRARIRSMSVELVKNPERTPTNPQMCVDRRSSARRFRRYAFPTASVYVPNLALCEPSSTALRIRETVAVAERSLPHMVFSRQRRCIF